MQDDYPYDWVMHWLSKQPAWSRAREFEITTRNADSSRLGVKTPTDQEFEEDEEFGLVDDDEQLVHGRRKRKVALTPSAGEKAIGFATVLTSVHLIQITRTSSRDGTRGELKISVVARNNAIIKKLVLQAKYEYEQDMEHRVHIFLADQGGGWRWNGARHKRPMSSIVLEPGVKDMLLTDAKDFLRSEDWYAERGIPFRRGYLLHGVPGSGKTSLIHALAGELGLDIYVVSLNMKGMSDNTLANLMGRIPQRCILLLEVSDLDAAFTRGTSRDTKSTGAPTAKTAAETKADDPNTLSLSGLLNCLDGVAAAEGRLLFATTNHIERLDPALSRPGRMDGGKPRRFSRTSSRLNPRYSRRRAHPEEAEEAEKKRLANRRRDTRALVPLLDVEEISELAKRFAQHIPEDELSVASLQGYLLKNKTRPRECVDEVADWIIKERETKARLKREKEEKERLEKEEAEEKEKKEKEEKEKKEKEEKREKRKKEKEEKLEKERKLKLEQEARDARRQSRTSSSSSTSVTASTSSATTGTTNSTATTDSETSDDESDAATTKTRTTTNSTESQTTEPSGSKWVNVKGATGGPVSTAGIIESVTDLIA
ncbi:P-loop containing nucleoside triphosphate hydrolase protein [Rhizoctonia solani]|uniref:P-loop containing nucleoside triphosphate hydrolase protein n=1 Tax=Rhizoctonia solani TaxID=456999 RepID=A0A8H7IHD3_9AGAM|nr:P-loop containing nucleoside triphosphate hydrolase protein [Rhizoctonia solani]